MKSSVRNSIIRKIHGDDRNVFVYWRDVKEIRALETVIHRYKDQEQNYSKIFLDYTNVTGLNLIYV